MWSVVACSWLLRLLMRPAACRPTTWRRRSRLYLQIATLNPILHTAWLDNHAPTVKSNPAKYYFCSLLYLQIRIHIAPLNPILHTAWLDNHAPTLKSNSAKYYFHEKIQIFAYLPKILL
jgi:hypothetical protein